MEARVLRAQVDGLQKRRVRDAKHIADIVGRIYRVQPTQLISVPDLVKSVISLDMEPMVLTLTMASPPEEIKSPLSWERTRPRTAPL